MTDLFDIVHEIRLLVDHLLVINKQSDLVCHPTKHGPLSSLISRVRLYLGEAVRPHLINRLDRETSGLVVVAKTPEAALELRRKWEANEVEKRYLAIVHGRLGEAATMVDAPLGKDERSPVAIKDCVRMDGAQARTELQRLHVFSRDWCDYSLLEVRPMSGRKHQIRIHLAFLGHPIVGDKLYGSDERFYLDFVEGKLAESARKVLIFPSHALHAHRISLVWRSFAVEFASSPEPWFCSFVPDWEWGRETTDGHG